MVSGLPPLASSLHAVTLTLDKEQSTPRNFTTCPPILSVSDCSCWFVLFQMLLVLSCPWSSVIDGLLFSCCLLEWWCSLMCWAPPPVCISYLYSVALCLQIQLLTSVTWMCPPHVLDNGLLPVVDGRVHSGALVPLPVVITVAYLL